MPLGTVPQLLHIGAVTLSHNRLQYSVRGRVSFDFRDINGLLVSFRLQSLQYPESPLAGPAAIDVWLGGRWRSAAAKLTKHQLVQVDCAVVARASDVSINALRLELQDPMPDLPFANHAAVCLLDEDLVIRHSLLWTQLAQGLQSAALTAGVPEGTAAWASPQRRQTRVSVGESSREYTYSTVAEIWERTQSGTPRREEKVHVYGVVIDCRAPCVTRGPDLRCEVIVADESSMRGGEFKTLAIYCFEKNPADCIPFRGVGDVIRAHRLNVGRYDDHASGVTTVQGVGRFYSTFLLWSFEGGDFLPIASRDPVKVGRERAMGSVTHNITSHDRERISALRMWARTTFFRLHKVHRPYMRTVLEVATAHETADFLVRSFDLICKVEDFYDEQSGKLKFTVSDGLLERHEKQTLLVESSDLQGHIALGHTFVDFCPNWGTRPEVLPAWLLIRDARLEVGAGRVIRLTVGTKTSTLVWHHENSPEVRHVQDMFRESRMGTSASSLVPPASLLHQNGAGLPAPPNGAARTPIRATYGQRSPVLPPRQQQSAAVPSRVAGLDNSLSRKRPSSSTSAAAGPGGVSNPVQKAARMERRDDEQASADGRSERQNPAPVDEANLPTFHPIQETTVITTHPNKQFPVSTIADMQKAVKDENMDPHRLRVSARAMIRPRDVRFACRPWCEKCSKLLRIDRNKGDIECLSCSDKFTATSDPNLKWSYLVSLNLEDSSGSRVECWLDGKEGSQFFSGLPPANLLSDIVARQKVNRCLQTVLDPKHVLDCCVKPYEYEDKLGVYHIACKLFATNILPEFMPKE